MRNIAIPLVFLAFIFTGCLKNDKCSRNDSSVVAPTSEVANLNDSLNSHGISATPHPVGFYYNIVTPGTGKSVSNLCDNIVIDYKGSLLNGTVFDSTTANNPATFELGTLIVGWQKGIPLIKVGGEIDLYIPPSLAYGNVNDVTNPRTGEVIIPKGSNLIFHIKILDIQ